MLITCPRCQTVFQLADEMLPADASSVKVKCSHCQTVFSLPEPVPPEVEFEQAETSASSSFEIPETPAAEMEADIAAETETKDDEVEPDIFDVSEGLVEEPQAVSDFGSMGVDPGVEEVPGETSESNQPDGEKTDETVADDVVFELANDLADDDLSWDMDDDHEMTAAPESEPDEIEEDRQTVMDEEGLSPAAADDGKAEAKNFSAEAEMSENTMPAPDDGGFRTATEEGTPSTEETAKVRLDSRRTFLFLGLIFVVLSLAVWGGMLLWQKFSIDMEKHLSIVGLESRNYIFSSDKRVIAIRGKLYNTSPKVVGKLRIKGVIVDRQGKVLAEKVTSGGVTFSADELQNLDGKMVGKLENPAAIVPANGGELPFMLVFYGFPPSASSYHVELAEFSVLKKGNKP
ncbi:MAG: zinc-ribbon domain-containing protein [Deltaproteobacteria bacterium]|nr:zinc-ribbon domain-containing protein [Deltaproteobacteria bacterium]